MAVEEIDLIQVTLAVQKLTNRMDAYLDHQTTANSNTVIHRTEGMGPWWSALAVAACLFTSVGLIIINHNLTSQLSELRNGEVRDLRAWVDLYRGQIAALKQQQEKPK